MKTRAIIAVLFTLNVAAGQPVRKIGTNIYDLSPVMAARGASNSYYIEGKVLGVDESKVFILRVLATRFYMAPGANPLQMNSGDLLGYLASSKLSEQPLSPGNVMALSPQMRQYVEAVDETQTITIAHYPWPCVIGQILKTYAIPLGNPKSCTVWDYGTPISGIPPGVDRIIRVYPTEMRWEKIQAGRPKSIDEQPAKPTFDKESQLASNGVPAAQFGLGLRFLNGDGVETNKAMGLYWIYKASYQDLPEAKEFLRQRPQ